MKIIENWMSSDYFDLQKGLKGINAGLELEKKHRKYKQDKS